MTFVKSAALWVILALSMGLNHAATGEDKDESPPLHHKILFLLGEVDRLEMHNIRLRKQVNVMESLLREVLLIASSEEPEQNIKTALQQLNLDQFIPESRPTEADVAAFLA